MDEVKDPLPNHTIFFLWNPAVGIHVLKGYVVLMSCASGFLLSLPLNLRLALY